jgi:hypothetical protein
VARGHPSLSGGEPHLPVQEAASHPMGAHPFTEG